MVTEDNPFVDDQGNPALPLPTTAINLADPYAVVLDMTMPGPDGKPVQRKLLRFMDRTNPRFAVDVLVDEQTCDKLAEKMTARRSGIVKADASVLSKLGLPR